MLRRYSMDTRRVPEGTRAGNQLAQFCRKRAPRSAVCKAPILLLRVATPSAEPFMGVLLLRSTRLFVTRKDNNSILLTNSSGVNCCAKTLDLVRHTFFVMLALGPNTY